MAFKDTKSFDLAITVLLQTINEHGSKFRSELEDGIDKQELDDVIETCYRRGYIQGISNLERAMNGNIHYNIVGDVRLTYNGLAKLESGLNN